MGQNNLTDARSIRMTPQGGVLAQPTDLGCLYVAGIDLYFNDASGNQIRVTQSGGIAGSPGSIANLTSPATATYVSANGTFVWQSDVNVAANMDLANAILRNSTVSSFGLTLKAPTLASDYDITLPQLPASNLPVSISATGQMTAAPITNVQTVYSLVPTGGVLQYAGAAAPTGFLLCDGSAVSRTTYAALYAAIGDAFGAGNGTTTFNLPDTGGRFVRGVDNGQVARDPDSATRTASATGGNTGNNVGSVETDELKSHAHTLTDPGHFHKVGATTAGKTASTTNASTNAGSGGPPGRSAAQSNDPNYAWNTNSEVTGITMANTGGAETRPINIYFNYIIKT
jgi:microcystin-dependent protein